MIYPGITPVVCDVIRPRPFVPTVDWAAQHITLPPGSELRGRFRPDLFPHMIEPLQCFDDPFYRTITLQFASRLGKTVGGQVCLAKTATVNPNPMAWAVPWPDCRYRRSDTGHALLSQPALDTD